MWEVLGGLLVACAVSGVVPVVNAELLVAGAAVALPGMGLPLVAAAATAGQMLTKTVLFGLARRGPSALPRKARRVLERGVASVEARGGAMGTLVFVSAASGIPPFYGVSLAAGALRMKAAGFVLAGAAGRAVRFGAVAWAAHALGAEAVELMASAGPGWTAFAGVGGAAPAAVPALPPAWIGG